MEISFGGHISQCLIDPESANVLFSCEKFCLNCKTWYIVSNVTGHTRDFLQGNWQHKFGPVSCKNEVIELF